MTLIKFINEFMDEYQDFQIQSGRTGEILSSVSYLENSNWLDWDLYGDCQVLGIFPDKINDSDACYIRIMIDTKKKGENEDSKS